MPRAKKATKKATKTSAVEEDAELQKALEISMAMQRQEEERRVKLEAEVKRKIAEEEKQRRAQQALLEEQQERAAQQEAQEKAKQEQEKRKRLEEQVQKKLEAERQKETERQRQSEEKRRQLEEEERKRYEEQEQKRNKSADVGITEFVPAKTEADTIDLLGGLTDDEEEVEVVPRHEPQLAKRQQQSWEKQEAKEFKPQQPGYAAVEHRDQPQRGNLDVVADNYFDDAVLSVSVKKTSKTDGVYLFGARVMKLQIQNGQLVVAISPKNKMNLDDFIAKFDRVEALRAKGLQSALNMCTMLGGMKQTPVKSGSLIKA